MIKVNLLTKRKRKDEHAALWREVAFVALSAIVLIAAAVAFTGCGKQEYVKNNYAQNFSAAGVRQLPAKVDILMVLDNSASINKALTTVQGQLTSFTQSLQSNFWDYHVATTTIVNPTNVSQVLVNPTYNSATLPDGTANPNTQGLVPSSAALTSPSSLNMLPGTAFSGSNDHTYDGMLSVLKAAQTDTVTNFLRSDALLAVIVVTNGADYVVDPSHNGSTSTTPTNSNITYLQTYSQNLIALKGGNSNMVRFYPIAAYSYHSGNANDYCLQTGSGSFIGTSYFGMNSYILGLPQYDSSNNPLLDFCTASSLQNVMAAISTNLQSIQQSYVFTSIVLPYAPVASSIQLYKNGTLLSQDPNNGWTYSGYETNVPTVTATKDSSGNLTNLATGIDLQTGWVLSLHGSAVMSGSDTPSLTTQKQ